MLYRASSDHADLAIKFTIRDERDRAGREYAALQALRQADLHLAPQSLLLDRERYPQPVVVQTWLAGTVLDAPPDSDEDWESLLEHLGAVHIVKPESVTPLLPVVLTMRSASEGRARIQENIDRLPPDQRPVSLLKLLIRLDRATFPTWPATRPRLCRGDCNCRNFLRRPGGWASVDWEYSGWGDPAFEVADLLCAPSFLKVTPDRREWAIRQYSMRSADPTIALRIQTYYGLMLVWWVARLARSRYEIPLGRDQRLAARSPNWQAENAMTYERYLQRAWNALG